VGEGERVWAKRRVHAWEGEACVGNTQRRWTRASQGKSTREREAGTRGERAMREKGGERARRGEGAGECVHEPGKAQQGGGESACGRGEKQDGDGEGGVRGGGTFAEGQKHEKGRSSTRGRGAREWGSPREQGEHVRGGETRAREVGNTHVTDAKSQHTEEWGTATHERQ